MVTLLTFALGVAGFVSSEILLLKHVCVWALMVDIV